MLIYNPKKLSQAAYFPFAEFSPEWQAIRFGLKRELPIHFMDLPQGIFFNLENKAAESDQLSMEETHPISSQMNEEDKRLFADPLGYLAKLGGYNDSERWWEIMFERQSSPQEIFPAILEMMTELRNALKGPLPPRERLREAHMRKILRTIVKKGYEKIAVICGSWHTPALNLQNYKSSDDNKILKGIKKVNVKATWIPWSYHRLSNQSGYGAGVFSPAWYQLLFHQPEEVVLRWMTRLAQLLRKADLDASSAHVIEAVRLAETLATLRKLALPGIEEMEEAAIAIFCEGDATKFDLVKDKLIVGNAIGEVPESIPRIPLQQDLEKRIRSVRLGKDWENPEPVDKMLDLRKATQLAASHLLHRLNILDVKWGKPRKVKKGESAGAFHEKWKLQWRPDFILKIIEAGMWGNTVVVAASNKVKRDLESIDNLPDLTKLLEVAFNADLQDVLEALINSLQDVSVLTRNVTQLMDALPPLVNTYRYGSTRGINLENLLIVIQQFIPRIAVALPSAIQGIDEDVAESFFEKITAVNRCVFLLNEQELIRTWLNTLHKISQQASVNGMLKGMACRILFDKEDLSLDIVASEMSLALSLGNDREQAAYWVEGFLHGSGLLIIHNPKLWNILNEWIDKIPLDQLTQLLPLLRRSFSEFTEPERQKMMELARKGYVEENLKEDVVVLQSERAELVIPTLKRLLGLK